MAVFFQNNGETLTQVCAILATRVVPNAGLPRKASALHVLQGYNLPQLDIVSKNVRLKDGSWIMKGLGLVMWTMPMATIQTLQASLAARGATAPAISAKAPQRSTVPLATQDITIVVADVCWEMDLVNLENT
jgi:hypothetical protein